ncbi:MAG: 4-hydroxy-3-methylbut-2-enyl diphosphate reductase [Dictyoglomus sp. NZ13-RE01]|nr:MAG: 4-hydroxy-3-methylbut-2-enyl diphosphate reductase [Dictyoglomus sp. NZ13-RE01]
MIVYVIKPFGFCSGVRRSINLALDIKKNRDEVYTLGALVHNPKVIEELERENIKLWSSQEKPKNKTLLIRAHGLPWYEVEEYKSLGNEIFDATCPLVKKVQKIVEFLVNNKYSVIIIGEKKHPEVKGILSYAKGNGFVVQNKDDLDIVKNLRRVGIVSQTTQNWEEVKELIYYILDFPKEIRIFNTICPEVEERQKKAEEISKEVHVMLVLGGKNSANTKRLFQISSKNTTTYHIENVEELRKDWFDNNKVVGIISGTSTPDDIIKEVIERLREWYPLEISYR